MEKVNLQLIDKYIMGFNVALYHTLGKVHTLDTFELFQSKKLNVNMTQEEAENIVESLFLKEIGK